VTNLFFLSQTTDDLSAVKSYLKDPDLELRRVAMITARLYVFTSNLPGHMRGVGYQYDVTLSGRISGTSLQVETRVRANRPATCLEGDVRQALSNYTAVASETAGLWMNRSRGFSAGDGKRGRTEFQLLQ
jgi:hypothetical protein